MFILSISISLVLVLVDCDYAPFKIVGKLDDHEKEVSLFKRLGDRCCHKYLNESNPDIALFLRENHWIINTNVTKLDSSACPQFHYFTKNTLVDKIDFEAENFEFCTTLKDFVIDDENSKILNKNGDGKNCENHLKEMLTDNEEVEYVFMSTTQVFVSEWETLCSFSYAKDAEIMRTEEFKASSLTLHTRDCNQLIQLKLTGICTNDEVIDEEMQSDESSTEVSITIAIVVTVVTCLVFFLLFFMKKKGAICTKDDAKNETMVHQNELYGNVSNEDYFNERYITNIVDANQYYDDEYQA